jgi:hypothetical protein
MFTHRQTQSVIPVLVLTLALLACSKPHDQIDARTSVARISAPTNPNDAKAWETYMVQVSKANGEGLVNRPYLFLVPSGEDSLPRERRKMIQQALGSMASHNTFPGNFISVSGPDPTTTADVLVEAFSNVRPGSLKGITLLYTGDEADKPRTEKIITIAGASFRFAVM